MRHEWPGALGSTVETLAARTEQTLFAGAKSGVGQTMLFSLSGEANELYHRDYTAATNSWEQIVNKHPLPDDSPMTRNYPDKLSDLEYPRWESGRFV